MNYKRLYEYRFQGLDSEERRLIWKEIASYLYELMGRPEKVLDPASGYGEFIRSIPAKERWAVDEFDYESRGNNADITHIVSDVFSADLPKNYFDSIFVSNFLEHLDSQQQVASFFEQMLSSVKEGGQIVVMGPNFKYCSSHYFDCADHSIALTDISISEHLYAAGFQVKKRVSRFLPYSFRTRLPTSASLVKWYLKCPPAWKLMGKQYLVIAQREGPVRETSTHRQ